VRPKAVPLGVPDDVISAAGIYHISEVHTLEYIPGIALAHEIAEPHPRHLTSMQVPLCTTGWL